MAAGQKLYPRATIKKIVKAHSNKNISKNADVLVDFPVSSGRRLETNAEVQIFLDYALFLQTYVSLLPTLERYLYEFIFVAMRL
jgi:hypothetical protein